MVLEAVTLNIKEGESSEFEKAFLKAQKIISSIKGYQSHELQKCIEKENNYILLVRWESLEAHTVNFRESEEYQEWRELLHHFYEPFPEVNHYSMVCSNAT